MGPSSAPFFVSLRLAQVENSIWQVEAKPGSIKESQGKHQPTNDSESDGESEGSKRDLNFPVGRK